MQGETGQGVSAQSAATPSGAGQRTGAGTVLPVIEEALRVGKRAVQRGGVRIFQRLRETPVKETVQLRDEHVSVERHPVDRPAGEADLANLSNFQEKTIEVRETAEEAVVEKTARVVEQVVVGKQVTEHEQEIADTLRRTEVEVEALPADSLHAPGSGNSEHDFRQHYAGTYAASGRGYDDYFPAYSYGVSMASEDGYKGRPWHEIEAGLRRNWETRYPASDWDDFKAAVQHGWDKVTGQRS